MLKQYYSTSQVVTHKKLNKFLQEYQDGKHESSVVSYQTAESLTLDDKQTWREIRKELEGIGMTVTGLDANKDFILQWFQDAIATGAFDERAPDGDLSDSSSDDKHDASLSGSRFPASTCFATDTSSLPNHLNSDSPIPVLLNEQSTESSVSERFGSSLRLRKISDSSHIVDERLGSDLHPNDPVISNGESKESRQRKSRRTSRLTAVISRLSLRSKEGLYEAAAYGKLSKVIAHLQNGADIEANVLGMTALCVAAQNGNYEVVKYLLQSGADVNAWSGGQRVVLDRNALPEREKRVRLLLAPIPEADFIPIEQTALHAATHLGHIKVSKLLLENGADADIGTRDHGHTPLHLAVARGRKNMVALLLENTTDIDRPNIDGITPLNHAVLLGYKDIVILLLENGADINRAGKSGATPLFSAVDNGLKDIAILLLEHGADMNRYTYVGTTPLHVAVQRRFEDIVHLLLEHGADINVADQHGHTPLLTAADIGYSELLNLLLRKGAHPLLSSKEGRTPKQQALVKGNQELFNILTAYEETWLQNVELVFRGVGDRSSNINDAGIENVEDRLPTKQQVTASDDSEMNSTEINLTAVERISQQQANTTSVVI